MVPGPLLSFVGPGNEAIAQSSLKLLVIYNQFVVFELFITGKYDQRHPSCPHRHKASVEISAVAATLPSWILCMWVILTNFNMPELLTCFDEKSQAL